MYETGRRKTSFGSNKPAMEIRFQDVNTGTDLDVLRRQATRHVLGRELTATEFTLLAQQRAARSGSNNPTYEIPGLRYHPTSEVPMVYERFDSPANRTALLKFDPRSSGSEALLVLIHPRITTP